jgi:hypothetical protein
MCQLGGRSRAQPFFLAKKKHGDIIGVEMDSIKMYFSNQSFTIVIPRVLFKNWTVNPHDNTFSYVASMFFAFAIAFLSQSVQLLLNELDDEWIRHQKSTGKRWLGEILQSIVYMFYISIAFVTMLLLMTYNFGFFMVCVLHMISLLSNTWDIT